MRFQHPSQVIGQGLPEVEFIPELGMCSRDLDVDIKLEQRLHEILERHRVRLKLVGEHAAA